MQLSEEDAARLWDMLEYGQQILRTSGETSFEAYLQDENLRLATERRIEIIGEAARNVSREFQKVHPEIPWRRIIAQRNVLAHEYGEIRQDAIYRLATINIPELVQMLRPLVPPPPPEDAC